MSKIKDNKILRKSLYLPHHGVLRKSHDKIVVHKSPESVWTNEDPVPTIERVYALNRKDLVSWMNGWLDDLEAMRGTIPNLEDQNSHKMRQRIAALKRTIVLS